MMQAGRGGIDGMVVNANVNRSPESEDYTGPSGERSCSSTNKNYY